MIESSHRLYLLIRTDLPSMNPGRAMAQAAHAANQFVYSWGQDKNVRLWQKEAKGFGTTICLAATSSTIYEIINLAMKKGHVAGLVFDPTYKFELDKEIADLINNKLLTSPTIIKEDGKYIMFRNELTCAYLFISADDPDKEMLVGELLLHP